MKEQNYSNHTALYPPFHYVVVPFLLAYTIRAIWLLVQTPSADHAWSAAFAFVVLLSAFTARGMALKVQDRVIRLEMRLRLASVLPQDQHAHIPNLTPRQLVGLRFASDRELPTLVSKVVSGELSDPKSIKKAVQNWEADHFRA
jgi:hypothetical protein